MTNLFHFSRRVSGVLPLIAVYLLIGAGPLFAWSARDYPKYNHKTYTSYAPFNERIDFNNINFALLNAAVLYETNRQRASKGKVPLQHSVAMEKAATGHSRDMARLNFFSHDSPVPGKATMVDRMAKFGVTRGFRAENIASTFGIEYQAGKPVFSPEQNGGFFSYKFKGDPIPAHTYSGLARSVVGQWMKSPGHRRNILKDEFRFLGVGTAYFEKREFFNMAHFNFTQNFGSEDA